MSGKLMVGIVVGSESDLDVMSKCCKVLDEYGIGWEMGVMSAHRAGDVVRSYAQQAAQRGLRVLVAGAGAAAHLPGVLASLTTLPVIGVPLAATPLSGFDSLLSIVQMPPGIPVATVAVGDMGARNAGHLAAEIIGLFDGDVAASLTRGFRPVVGERTRVSSGSPYEARIGFSRAVAVGDRVVVSGTAPVWPDGECDPDAYVQARRCLDIIDAALTEAGVSLADVVRTRMFLVDPGDAEAVGRAHGEVFGDTRPAATMVVVKALLDPRWKVEIEAEAQA
jgi:5-(carboxyamino)imidazole ribonucleotide mutase